MGSPTPPPCPITTKHDPNAHTHVVWTRPPTHTHDTQPTGHPQALSQLPEPNIDSMHFHHCSTPQLLKPLRDSIFDKPPSDKAAHRIDLAHATGDDLQILTDACDRATFGLNQKDILDETYRGGRKARRNVLLNADYTDSTRPIQVELYKLNVYRYTTERVHVRLSESLVLVFPTPHKGGALVFRHRDQEWTFDSALALTQQAGDTPSIGYAAFFRTSSMKFFVSILAIASP
ncbi:hypothetical protein EVG20_g6560 [Dentipellis fragilis]|uniref:Uncharacterized protein n=1 Tax=Dentipellis fragilis TaxID=205917 RepID=A0A4Y9YP78_9AGAM|nr:hypothetical protein EVG20_g6560 [Dentipellis fragilis]